MTEKFLKFATTTKSDGFAAWDPEQNSKLAKQLATAVRRDLYGQGYQVKKITDQQQNKNDIEQLIVNSNNSNNNPSLELEPDAGGGLNFEQHELLPDAAGIIDPSILPQVDNDGGGDLSFQSKLENAKNKNKHKHKMNMKLSNRNRNTYKHNNTPRFRSSIPKPKPGG